MIHMFSRKSKAECMSSRVVGDKDETSKAESSQTLDFLITQLIWERALRSDDDGVLLAIENLWSAVQASEKK